MDARVAGVVGLGLIGGSVALRLLERGWVVLGSDLDPEAEEIARRAGVDVRDGVRALAQAAEVLFLCVPVDAVQGVLAEVVAGADGRDERLLVTDVASVKRSVAAAARAVDGLPGSAVRFVPGHPMAGTERSGMAAASAELFDGARWVLCPSEHAGAADLVQLAAIVTTLGAQIALLEPDVHDRVVAMTSHLPHVLAAGLLRASADKVPATLLGAISAGSFRDVTRVGAADPAMWAAVTRGNAAEVEAALEQLLAELTAFREQLDGADPDRLEDWFAQGRGIHAALSDDAPAEERLEVSADAQGWTAAVAAMADGAATAQVDWTPGAEVFSVIVRRFSEARA